MKIVSIVGARPQFVKAATVSRVLRRDPAIREILLHTGQHYDDNMSEIFFRELNIPEPDYNLGVGSGSHAEQTGTMLKRIEEILLKEKPDCTLVYGDTNSTLAGALTSAKLHIPVAHVEAGLRSFNRAMPEEINRIVTDRIAGLLFAPTQTAVGHLTREGLGDITCFTGDVMYDSVLYYRDWLLQDPEKYRTPGIPANYLLATIHRAENTDNPVNLKNIFSAFSELDQEIILPIHPRTRKILQSLVILPENVHIIDPVGYLQMLKLTLDATRVLTDSGGLQKEAYFLQKPCITLRTETEWVETLHDHWNIITGSDPRLITQAATSELPSAPIRPAFGNGKAAEMILQKLLLF
ncbi:MAG: UDP-N-acetylglucosamine 2-epimerase (non-hydrolyzing) [Bacteroidota bacterium]